MHTSIASRRRLIAVVATGAALALPTAAFAHGQGQGPQGKGDRDTAAAHQGRPDHAGTGAGKAKGMGKAKGHRGAKRGPSAARLATELDLERTTVRTAMRDARRDVREITDRTERAEAFKAALATRLGVDVGAIETAFEAIRADNLSKQVDRLVTRGVLTTDQAATIDAQIEAGDLDGAHDAIKAAKAAARAAAGTR